jgi:hypothetical protein
MIFRNNKKSIGEGLDFDSVASYFFLETSENKTAENEDKIAESIETARNNADTTIAEPRCYFSDYRVSWMSIDGGSSGFDELCEADEEFLQKLKLFYNKLRDNFCYYQFHKQFVSFVGDFYKAVDGELAAKFADSPTINQEINLVDREIVMTAIKTIMVGEESCAFLADHIENGRMFDESDFIIETTDSSFNVILGPAYSDYYKIGDTLTVSLYQKHNITLSVIGFLKKNVPFELIDTLRYSFSMTCGFLYIVIGVVALVYPSGWTLRVLYPIAGISLTSS